jgi:hypothetical protein
MPSKQVTDRQKSAQAVVAAVETHRDAASSAIANTLTPHLRNGEALPDVALFLSLVGRVLTAKTQSLVSADDAHQAELTDDDAPRAARDDASDELRQECIDLREILTGMYGNTIATQILPGPVPRDPVVVARYAQSVHDNLAKATFPAPRIPGASIDMTALLSRLAASRQKLEDSITAVAREMREAQTTQTAKDHAMDSFDDSFSTGAEVVSSLLRLGGMPEHAARVRPSTRSPGRTAAEDDSPAEPPAPPANG